MNMLNKLQPLIIIVSAMFGLFLGIKTPLSAIPTYYIELFLMLLLFMVFISIDVKDIKKSFLHIRYTATSLFINFIITPLLAYSIGYLFFNDSIAIRIGLLMLLVTPCTDWYLVFTGLAKGNVELNISILPLNLLLQIVLLPVYLTLFLGNELTIDKSAMLGSMLFVLLIPFACSVFYKLYAHRHKALYNALSAHSDALQLLFLCLAVMVMFTTEGESLVANPMLVLRMFMPLLCFFILIFFIAQGVGRLLRFTQEDIISLNFTTLARNSPLALAIAVAAFQELPLVSLVLVVGSLIELPTLSFVAWILLRWGQKKGHS